MHPQTDRVPPFDLDSEKALLSSLIQDPKRLDSVSLIVIRDDFYLDSHQTIFEQIEICVRKHGLDTTTLATALKMRNQWEQIGGATYLAEVMGAAPTAFHAKFHALQVAECSRRRQVLAMAEAILTAVHDPEKKADQCIAEAQQAIDRILERGNSEDLVLRGSDIAHRSIDELEKRKDGGGESGVRSGWSDLDRLLGGFRPGQLTIVAARPSVGKSAFCANIAEYAALQLEVTTLLVSLEMSGLELGDRFLSSLAQIDSFKIRGGYVTADELAQLKVSAGDLCNMPIRFTDKPLTVEQIAAVSAQAKRKDNLGLLIVDYLQLVDSPENERNREREVAKISRSLKRVAQSLELPVICGAQLNRSADNSKPKLSHLRESGAIEQDADTVIMLHRPNEDGTCEVIVAKNRNGPRHTIKLAWRKEQTRFESLDARDCDNFDQSLSDWNNP